MNVYRIELMVIDFDDIGMTAACQTLEDQRYPNRCIHPQVMSSQKRDIGEWADGNPLNSGNINTSKSAFDLLFEQV